VIVDLQLGAQALTVIPEAAAQVESHQLCGISDGLESGLAGIPAKPVVPPADMLTAAGFDNGQCR